jgi:hypothetical protein
MASKLQVLGNQLAAVLVSALAAFLISVLQSYLAAHGASCTIPTTPVDVGILGGILKSAHWAFTSGRDSLA